MAQNIWYHNIITHIYLQLADNSDCFGVEWKDYSQFRDVGKDFSLLCVVIASDNYYTIWACRELTYELKSRKLGEWILLID